jgi:hypothetical protein
MSTLIAEVLLFVGRAEDEVGGAEDEVGGAQNKKGPKLMSFALAVIEEFVPPVGRDRTRPGSATCAGGQHGQPSRG